MAFSNRNRQEESIADINITPFVDVVLVLLIIFMVAAPLLTVGVPLNCRKQPLTPCRMNRKSR